MNKKHAISYSYVPVEKLNTLSKPQIHQGVVARISAFDFSQLHDILNENISKTPLYLLLDQITDVRNFGAITRTRERTINKVVKIILF